MLLETKGGDGEGMRDGQTGRVCSHFHRQAWEFTGTKSSTNADPSEDVVG